MTTEEVVPGGAQEHAEVPQKAPERKKYVFKKRDPVQAAKLEAERLANMKHNPFGNAKPREAVLAERTGKDEATVVKEDANTYDIHLKLNSTQFAEKMARQHEINDLKAVLASGEGEEDPAKLKEDITKKEEELAELIKGFEEMLVEQAKSGQGGRVERNKPFDAERQDVTEDYTNFSRGSRESSQTMRSNRGSFQPGAYEDNGERDHRSDGHGYRAGGGRDRGRGRRGGRGGRRDNAWGGRDVFADGYNTSTYSGKGQGYGRNSHADGGGHRGTGHEDYHAAPSMPYPVQGMGYSYAAPQMYVGYTMPSSNADYLPVYER